MSMQAKIGQCESILSGFQSVTENEDGSWSLESLGHASYIDIHLKNVTNKRIEVTLKVEPVDTASQGINPGSAIMKYKRAGEDEFRNDATTSIMLESSGKYKKYTFLHPVMKDPLDRIRFYPSGSACKIVIKDMELLEHKPWGSGGDFALMNARNAFLGDTSFNDKNELCVDIAKNSFFYLANDNLEKCYFKLTMKVEPKETLEKGQLPKTGLCYLLNGMDKLDPQHQLELLVKDYEEFHTYYFKKLEFQSEAVKAIRVDLVNFEAKLTIRDFEIVNYTGDYVTKYRDESKKDLDLVLLSYYSRTGSTLGMKFLTRHPEIAGYTEDTHDGLLMSYFTKLYYMFKTGSLAPGNKGNDELFKRMEMFNKHYEVDYALPKPITFGDHTNLEIFRESYEKFLKGYLPQLFSDLGIKNLQNAKVYVEKQMDTLGMLESMLELYSNCKIIATFRDPRDVFISLIGYQKKRRVLKKDISEEALIKEIMFTYKKRLEIFENHDSIIYRYEDLMTNPYETAERLVDFLKIDNSPQILNNMAYAVTGQKDVQASEHITSKDASKSIGRWKHDLDKKYLKCFEGYDDVFERLGYEK